MNGIAEGVRVVFWMGYYVGREATVTEDRGAWLTVLIDAGYHLSVPRAYVEPVLEYSR